MVATAEFRHVVGNEYRATVAGNRSNSDMEKTGSGVWVDQDADGIESIGMEGGGEVTRVNANKVYDIIFEENEHGQIVITTEKN